MEVGPVRGIRIARDLTTPHPYEHSVISLLWIKERQSIFRRHLYPAAACDRNMGDWRHCDGRCGKSTQFPLYPRKRTSGG